MSNQTAWGASYVVQAYENTGDMLQIPEQSIFQILKDRLKSMKMLDIGIGTGRTTVHFAPEVQEYIGVDYAENMISVCEKRFGKGNKNIIFKVADARSLQAFGENHFDFILFSYNGIDYISHEDRIKVFKEIRWAGKKGGIFVFSTHNIQTLREIYRIKLFKNPKKSAYQILSFFALLFFNGLPGWHINKPFTIIRDRDDHFRFNIHYIKPEVQVKQLEELGFKNIRLFSLISGQELKPKDYSNVKDHWIYYMCEM